METVGIVAAFLFGLIGDVVTTIVTTPILLIPVAAGVAGIAIRFAKKFIRG